ncbi:hypothetical protein [Leifsonia sp. TF02-11]|uniref:hypothetical protein n=1 Tax=Leifsonia sp. TF02-11 TaxID=2815212 RepID=UPI001AA0DC77|nr:hypothetical protein [Leifsonia sp. TF02-11]MBO1741029.1 hypothetical protein [Leifsonia sp. TF02-11]
MAADNSCGPFQWVCDTGSNIGDAIGGFIPEPVKAITGGIQFAANPPGWIIEQFQNAIQFLAGGLIPWVLNALKPDFSARWFLQSYALSFGLSLLVLAVISLFVVFERKSGKSSGRTVIDTFGIAMPAFLIGTAFGPAIGIATSTLITSLVSWLAQWGVSSSTVDFYSNLAHSFSKLDVVGSGIGYFMGGFLLLAMIVTLVAVVLMLMVQLAMQYLMGAIIPLGYVWIVHPATRKFGWKGPIIFSGIAISHVLLFLLLGIAYKAVNANIASIESDATNPLQAPQTFVKLGLTVLMMGIAALAPAALWRLARFTNPAGGGGTTRDGGVSAPNPNNIPAPQGSSSPARTAQQSPGGASGEPIPAAGPAAAKGGGAAASPASGGAAASAGSAGGAATGAGGALGGAGGALGGAGGALGGAGAAAGGAGAAAGGAGAMAGAGAAASATGVGAAVGVPMLLAAGARAVAAGFQKLEAHANQIGEAGDERD